MANSIKPGPATHHGKPASHRHRPPTASAPQKPLLPAKTPGPNGNKDQGDPNHASWLGWTPNLTGVRDWADHSLHDVEDWFHHALGRIGLGASGVPVSTGSKPLVSAKGVLTKELLKKIFKTASDDLLQRVADELNADPVKYGLDTPLRRAHFFAQVLQEGGRALASSAEDLYYRPSVLKDKFPYYRANPADADADGMAKDAKTGKITHRPDMVSIANHIYGGRKDLGNGSVESGDGYKFRGRGLIQVTGRYNYQQITIEYRKLFGEGADFEKDPDQMTKPPYDIRSAVCFWIWKGLPQLADKGATDAVVDSIVDVINRLTDTREKRKANFRETYDVFKQ